MLKVGKGLSESENVELHGFGLIFRGVGLHIRLGWRHASTDQYLRKLEELVCLSGKHLLLLAKSLNNLCVGHEGQVRLTSARIIILSTDSSLLPHLFASTPKSAVYPPQIIMSNITPSPLPKTQKAYTQSETGFPLTLTHNALVPTLKPGQVLIRVHATALNPTDHKMPTSFPSAGAVAGCDFAGTVIKTASSAQANSAPLSPRLQVGDGVFGSVHGSNPIDHCSGAFAEYVAADADLLIKMPEGRQTLERMSWTQAAAWGGVGWGTLGIALWEEERGLGLQWPWGRHTANKVERRGDEANSASKGDGAYVLVNGGATATGTLAVQLLRL